MASAYVRAMVKGWLAAAPLPFVDTVALEATPSQDAWCTVDWTFADRQRVTFCDQYAEVGTFAVMCFFRPGFGDANAMTQAEAVTAALMANVDPSAALELINHATPEDFSEDAWYVLSTEVNYRMTEN